MRHQRVELLIEILLIHMKIEMVFDEHILNQIGITQINGWIENFVITRVRCIWIVAVGQMVGGQFYDFGSMNH